MVKACFCSACTQKKDAQEESIATVQAICTVLHLANSMAASKKMPSWLAIEFNLVSFAL